MNEGFEETLKSLVDGHITKTESKAYQEQFEGLPNRKCGKNVEYKNLSKNDNQLKFCRPIFAKKILNLAVKKHWWWGRVCGKKQLFDIRHRM